MLEKIFEDLMNHFNEMIILRHISVLVDGRLTWLTPVPPVTRQLPLQVKECKDQTVKWLQGLVQFGKN